MKNATTGNGNRVYVSVSSQFSVHMTAKYVWCTDGNSITGITGISKEIYLRWY